MRILIVKTSSLGDVIHCLPVVSDIRRQRPDAHIDWVVEESFADIPRLHPGVDQVIPLAIRRWRKSLFSAQTWGEISAFRGRLKQHAYDLVLDCQGLLKSAIVSRQAIITASGHYAGHNNISAREPLAARFYDQSYAIPTSAHAVERNRWLAAAALNYSLNKLPCDYGLAPTPLQADWLPQPTAYAVFLTATSRDDKLWASENWVALGQQLLAQGIAVVLPTGNAAERERATRIAAQIAAAIVAPPLGIAELAGVIAGAAFVVGVDTGLTHLAAALARPTVAIFTATDPALTGVYAGEDQASSSINLGQRNAPPSVADVLAALPAKRD